MSTQTKAAHTPGPWLYLYDADGDHAILMETGELLAVTAGFGNSLNRGLDKDTDEANARLIAAAPELLEALENLLADVERNDNPRDEGACEHSGEMNAARAIIQKARGGQ